MVHVATAVTGCGCKDTCRFDGDVYIVGFPWEIFGFSNCRYLNGFSVDDEAGFSCFYGAVEASVDGVIFEEVSECCWVGEVVNRNDFHVCSVLNDFEDVAADTTESIDGNFNRHGEKSSVCDVR